MIRKTLFHKNITIVFILFQFFYVFLFRFPSEANAIVVNFTSADITLSNSRLSYRGMLGTTSSANDTKFTLSGSPVDPATDSNTNNLFINDIVCFNNPSSNGCASQTTYTVNSVPTNNSFGVSPQVMDALTEGTNVVATQSARWTVRFTPRTQVPSGGFLRLTIPHTSLRNADGMPDAVGFDAGKLPSNLLSGTCASNACLSFSGFSASAATLATTAGVGHVILITLSSGLTQGTPYSFTLGHSSTTSLQMINPSQVISSNVYLLSEDDSRNALDLIIIKLLNVDGVQVSASVGEGGIPGEGSGRKFSLYGYTSPSAQVNLEGIGIKTQTTTSDKTGFFAFENNLSPLLPQEACLTTIDQLGRLSNPTCLPPFPINYDVNIGPVLLPPTLSLNKPEYYTGEEIVISGQTIPNTDVILSLFVDPSKKSLISSLMAKLNPVKSVYAFGFPDLKTKSDNVGNYSLKIPSAKSDLFRLYARSLFEKQSTPQSTRLSLEILSIWRIFIVYFFILIILIAITVLPIYLLRRYLSPHKLASQRALMIQEKHPIMEI